MTHKGVKDYEEFKRVLTNALVLAEPDYSKLFKSYIDACLDGLGAALHQEHLVKDFLIENPILFISRKKKDTEKRHAHPETNLRQTAADVFCRR